MKDPFKKYTEKHREAFDNLEVPEDALGKILLQLEEKKTKETKIRPLFSYKIWAVAASVVLFVSLGTFLFWPEKETSQPTVAVQKSPKTEAAVTEKIAPKENNKTIQTDEKNDEELAKNSATQTSDNTQKTVVKTNFIAQKTETKSEKENAIELMNNELSASSRLQGIALAKKFPYTDPQMIRLLSEKAVTDENTNVRLAAVDVLAEHSENPLINTKLQDIFLHQNDPMVQKELITIFAGFPPAELNEKVNEKLLSLAKNPTTEAFVKDEAYAVLLEY